MTIYFLLVLYVNSKLSSRPSANIYNNCHKVWATRGFVPKGSNWKSIANSLTSVNEANRLGAKGSEVDVYFDSQLNRFILSHDKPYNLKDGQLLTLETLIDHLPSSFNLWIDFKQMSHLTGKEMEQAVSRLNRLVQNKRDKNTLYIEGESPTNLSYFVDAGYKTILDTHPLPNSNIASGFVLNIYKIVYYFGDYTVLGLPYSKDNEPIYTGKNIKSLDNIPVFIYHVEDNEELFKKLIMMKDVKVILNQHDYINYYNMSSCQTF